MIYTASEFVIVAIDHLLWLCMNMEAYLHPSIWFFRPNLSSADKKRGHESFLKYKLRSLRGNSDVGDRIPILVTSLRCWCPSWAAQRLCKKIVDFGDLNGQNRRQHLIVVTNTFRLQHPSPTSM